MDTGMQWDQAERLARAAEAIAEELAYIGKELRMARTGKEE